MKRTPPNPIKLPPEQVAAIEAVVFEQVEAHLPAAFYLLDVRFEREAGYWYLRIDVEGRETPVSLDDCERISREIDPLIDALPALQDLTFSLEVSSPGVFRPLQRAREFDFYQGRPVRIVEETGKKTPPKSLQEGILQGFDAERRVVTLLPANAEKPVSVPLADKTHVYLNPVIHFPEEED